MTMNSQSWRLRRRHAVVLGFLLTLGGGAAPASYGAVQADARLGLDTAGSPPVAGQPFLVSVLVESLPFSAGGSFPFVTTLEMPVGVSFVSVGRSEPLPFVCEASGQTLTCRSRHLGGNISSAANLSFRAPRPGSYTFDATVEIEGEPDTNPSNNAASRTVTVASAPPAAKPCIVPDVIRRTPPVARRAILRAGCRLGVTRTALSATVRKGLVMRQTPVARKRVAGGTKVTLVVSRGT
jgi:hypothetical protein